MHHTEEGCKCEAQYSPEEKYQVLLCAEYPGDVGTLIVYNVVT